MIERLNDKPLEFNHIVNDCAWFCLQRNGETYGYLAVDIGKSVAAVHIEIVKWRLSSLRELKKDWPVFVSMCQEIGIKRLVVSNKSDNSDKWKKFIKLFQFPEPDCILVSTQEI